MGNKIETILTSYNLSGTVVISSLSDEIYNHNTLRANERFTPASTFKILNSLIALEEKVILDSKEIIKWNGHIYKYTNWNRDQTLESAFKCSCVWFYQELAKRIGKDKYRKYFDEISFGEIKKTFEESSFWLDNSLKISAREQINFLKAVYQRTLPFSVAHYETLGAMMTLETTPFFRLFGKTGWGPSINSDVGWFVGYVESKKDVHFFATNLNIVDERDLPVRIEITKEALKLKRVI